MLKVYGIEVDVIEVFDYHVLVQESKTGMIYSVLLNDIECVDDSNETNETGNILSLEGWTEWQKEGKPKLNKSRNKRIPKDKKRAQLKLVRRKKSRQK